LLLPIGKAEPLIALIDKAMVEALAQAKKDNPAYAKRITPAADKPYRAVLDQGGKGTGDVAFHFRRLAKFTGGQTGETRIERPDLYDSKCRPLDPMKVNVGDGSTVKLAFQIYSFYTAVIGAGVSLRLRAVQVLKLIEPSDRVTAKDYGFVEEDGYEAGESVAGPPAPSEWAEPAEGRMPIP
jgi:hypothetical protein